MDTLKEAFNKVKQDIEILNKKLDFLSNDLSKTKDNLVDICEILKEVNLTNKKLEEQNRIFYEQNNANSKLFESINNLLNKNSEKEELFLKNLYNLKENFQFNLNNPANQLVYPTYPAHNPAQDIDFKPQNTNILDISSGNEGVPTDRQTNQQTNQQTSFNLKKSFSRDFSSQSDSIKSSYNKENSIDNAANILDSLDSIKKEIRLKFKRLTEQELTVFSAIYQLDEENGSSDYKLLSKRLNLTESSIRDYIGRLIKKGIPIEKVKVNNKQIQLNISSNLKKIATLNTILQLREL